jgi:hypothetical protein
MKKRIGNLIIAGIFGILTITGCGAQDVAKATTALAA